jgi:uncharacterized protein YmfQ (DUF2313 family)
MPLIQSLIQLLPEGLYWQSKQNKSSAFYLFLEACIQEFQRFQNTMSNSFQYINPQLSPPDFLNEWELALGLPEICASNAIYSIEERRRAAYLKLTRGRVATLSELEAVAHQNGFTDVAIYEFPKGLVAGAICNQPCYSEIYPFGLQVASSAFQRTSVFRAGSLTGEALATYRDTTTLRCVLEAIKPAHVFYRYELTPSSLADHNGVALLDHNNALLLAPILE